MGGASGRGRVVALLTWVVSGAVLVGTWFIIDATPKRAAAVAPFVVTVEPPQWGTGRNITARVVGALFTDRVDDGSWSATGNWLLVQIEAAAVADGTAAALAVAELSIGGVTYRASERPRSTIANMSLLVGVAITGALAFELPANVVSGPAEIRLGLSGDRRLDSLIVVPIELGHVERVPARQMPRVEWPAT